MEGGNRVERREKVGADMALQVVGVAGELDRGGGRKRGGGRGARLGTTAAKLIICQNSNVSFIYNFTEQTQFLLFY